MRQRGLRDKQVLRRLREVLGLGDVEKVAQLPHFHESRSFFRSMQSNDKFQINHWNVIPIESNLAFFWPPAGPASLTSPHKKAHSDAKPLHH
jgi:hypothetical protein